ncbi:hypothetical protein B0T17DRAFT_607983 [Bombardia bombarda]|uniref:Tyrosinase copper-binding domain-containing protein n=1 Tax=Bombardia bombarda TaxID=252184 RepID=A0AA40C582_9PEZI|nr:hypothetical protein B0T17DRAFT_607983 [Bombardia bombarda]
MGSPKSWLAVALLLVSGPLTSAAVCKTPIVRKEWRTLTTPEKSSYIAAVQCLLTTPSLTPPFPSSGVLSRYDDLLYTHIQQTFSIHYVGHFLAWHRFFVATHENMLRAECGYTGAQPYWDWTLDTPSSQFTSSPIFDPVTGFGGNGPYVAGDPGNPFAVPGRTGGGCVTDGPFAGVEDFVHLGPAASVTYNPQCLKRDFSPYFAGRYLGANQTQATLAQGTLGGLTGRWRAGRALRRRGCMGVAIMELGGLWVRQMGDLYVSPADPIFFLHHANLDRVWWSWQKLDLTVRLTDISGPIVLMDYANEHAGNVTLDFPLTVGPSAPDVTVGDVMNIAGCGHTGSLCYQYDHVYTLLA